MSRDYKPRSRATARKSRGSTLVGIFVGLVLGVAIAFFVVWYINNTPLPFYSKPPRTADKNGDAKSAIIDGVKPGNGPIALPGKPGDKVPEKGGDKPRFEFYKILPGDSEATPAPADKAETAAGKAAAGHETLYLQAGAFQNAADADNLKAKLALMGLEASVQQATTQDKGVMHRVRLGPYASQEELAKVRGQLQQNGIQASIVKTKEGSAN